MNKAISISAKVVISYLVYGVSLPLLAGYFLLSIVIIGGGVAPILKGGDLGLSKLWPLLLIPCIISGWVAWGAFAIMISGWVEDKAIAKHWPITGSVCAFFGLIPTFAFIFDSKKYLLPAVGFAVFLSVWHLKKYARKNKANSSLNTDLQQGNAASRHGL